MSVDQDVAASEDTKTVEELGEALGEAITDLPEYREFEAAREAVKDNDALQEQIAEFEEQRRQFAQAQQTGEASKEDVAALQRTQQELHQHPTMAEFLEAKSALQDRLETINEAISAPLAVDFGGEAGGCCQD